MAAIGVKDFPRAKKMLGLSVASFETAVQAADAWVAANSIEVISVETVRTVSGTNGNVNTTEDGVRVYYRSI
jgi:hypothetical protein